MKSDKKTTSLKDIYCGIQEEMIAADFRKVLRHPTDKGDRIEKTWISWFRNYLPKRYQAARATVIDSKGNTSKQIDVVLYDAQYTYMALNDGDGILYIPAESVYAVFEVKPNLTTDHMKYAGENCESVRKLYRTSADIYDYKGKHVPKKNLSPILSGILTISSGLSPAFGDAFKKCLTSLGDSDERLDCGCVLHEGAFFYDSHELKTSKKDEALVFFFLQLLQILQRMGTVPAIDFDEYKSALTITEESL